MDPVELPEPLHTDLADMLTAVGEVTTARAADDAAAATLAAASEAKAAAANALTEKVSAAQQAKLKVRADLDALLPDASAAPPPVGPQAAARTIVRR